MLIKNKKYNTTQRILTTWFIVLIVVPYIVLNLLQTFLYMSSIRSEIIGANEEILEQTNLNVEKQVDKIKNFLYAVSGSEELKELMVKSTMQKYNYDFLETYQKMGTVISNNTLDDLKIKGIVLVNNYSKIITYGDPGYVDFEEVDNSEWYRAALNAGGKFCWFTNQIQNEDGTHAFNLIAAKQILDITTLEKIGVIYVEVYGDFFDSLSSAEAENSILYVVDENKRPLLPLMENDTGQDSGLISRFNESFPYQQHQAGQVYRVEGNWYLTMVSGSNHHGWQVIEGIPIIRLIGKLLIACAAGAVVLLACFALFSVMFVILNRRISQPLQHLIGLVNEIKADPEAKVDLGKYPCYEVIQLNSDIVTLFQENEKINQELKENTFSKSKMELEKLQAEINPHFIYNTLTTIKYMAMQNHQTEISNMITALVKILRSTVNRDGQFVTVSEEFSNLRQYIYIQQVLNQNRIKFIIEQAPELDQCYMPNFLLQPLVENAILHGLNPKGCEGTVQVTAKQQDGSMVIEVVDDGVGMNREALQDLQLLHTNSSGLTNIALPGVMKRIELLYQGKGTFEIGAGATGGTKITIVLPIHFD